MHLGKKSGNIPDSAKEKPTKYVWNRMVEYAIDNRIDFIALPGDIADQDNSYFEAIGPLEDGFKKLEENNIKVIATVGNHDYKVAKQLINMEKFSNVYLLGLDDNLKNSQWTTKSFKIRGEKIQFIAWSFSTLHYKKSPFLDFDTSLVNRDAIVVGLNHGEVRRDQGLYAPMQLHEFSPLAQIWLVGHIHKPEILQADNPCVLYTGSPQALSAKETGKHGPFLITIHSKKNIEKELIALSPVRYEILNIDISDAEDEDSFNKIISSTLETHAKEIQEELAHVSYLVCDVNLTGTHSDIQAVEKWATNITDIELNVNHSQTLLTVRKSNLKIKATIENLEDLAKSNNSVGIIANTLLLLQKNKLNDFSKKTLDKWKEEKKRIDSASAYVGLRNAQRIELPSEEDAIPFLIEEFNRVLSHLINQKQE